MLSYRKREILAILERAKIKLNEMSDDEIIELVSETTKQNVRKYSYVYHEARG